MARSDGLIGDQYVITVRNIAGPTIVAAFSDLDVEVDGVTTVLRGVRADQAALHGVLQRIQDLGLEVLDVRRELDRRR
jgi:hypothetical protein